MYDNFQYILHNTLTHKTILTVFRNDAKFVNLSSTHYYFRILILSIVILSVSCSPERKLAKTFIESKPDISVLILPVDYVFKTNLKVDEIEDKKGMTDWQLDSALMANSVLLNDISDSAFLEIYVNSMIEEFERLGIKVYTESYLDSFLFIQTPAYILNIAQLEVEEFLLKISMG